MLLMQTLNNIYQPRYNNLPSAMTTGYDVFVARYGC